MSYVYRFIGSLYNLTDSHPVTPRRSAWTHPCASPCSTPLRATLSARCPRLPRRPNPLARCVPCLLAYEYHCLRVSSAAWAGINGACRLGTGQRDLDATHLDHHLLFFPGPDFSPRHRLFRVFGHHGQPRRVRLIDSPTPLSPHHSSAHSRTQTASRANRVDPWPLGALSRRWRCHDHHPCSPRRAETRNRPHQRHRLVPRAATLIGPPSRRPPCSQSACYLQTSLCAYAVYVRVN